MIVTNLIRYKATILCVTIRDFSKHCYYRLYAHSLPFLNKIMTKYMYNTSAQGKWSVLYIVSSSLKF